ncbi:hypothetical protein GCM10010967_55180 [Dyadobacter beijingensis]|uniref:DNA-binding NtrC family response regulator n=1 Tax=Dyadobacter beijingensis TaxID=365489 RepID=A0ABQ2IL61_9BACT|nr:sigma-54 dependent transcriptional regulator [Dyadobacter beijingensis]GGN12143.1 hypothetical protein GCM10010967_55180 [Dyadobacter beijingensis]
MQTSVLIVEDQFIEANNLLMILGKAGYEVLPIAHSVHAALNILARKKPDLVLLDIYLQGDLTGIDLAELLREKGIAFVYLSANSTKDILDAAKRTQPYGFLVKPFREKDVLVTLNVAHYLHEQRTTAPRTEAGKSKEKQPTTIIGKSAPVAGILDQIAMVADTDASILVTGESGTGKELVAQAIHNRSSRQNRPFVRVNCAALPASLIESELFGIEKGAFTGAYETKPGKFERAQNGTIFLDEIGEMPLMMQAKLLHVLQEREIERVGGKSVIKVNVRIIAATNRDLEREIAAGRFRIDLYYRLNVFPIALPPLRDRREDIPELAGHFMQQAAARFGKTVGHISGSAMQQLLQYDWPGNIRELQNVIERMVVQCGSNTLTHIDLDLPAQPARPDAPAEVHSGIDSQRDLLIEVLKKCGGRIAGKGGAAEFLGVNVSTLQARVRKLGIVRTKVFRV